MLTLLLSLFVQDVAPIPAEEYARRRDALADRFPGQVLVVPAEALIGGEMGIDADTPKFDFAYLVGTQSADGVLVLADGESILFGEGDGADVRLPRGEFEAFVADVLRSGDRVRAWAMGRRSQSSAVVQALRGAGVTVEGGLTAALAQMRVVKSESEIALMRYATDVTCRAHLDVLRGVHPGINEREIQEILESRFREEGCPENAFPSIVGSGPNSCIIHYMRNERQTEEGELVVVDIGAAYLGYAADVTRTLPVSGTFTDRQREIYQLVRDAQTAAEAILRPGVNLQEVDAAARRVIAAAGYGRYFPHHTSHYVGLSVHDSGSYDAPLPAGAVITIEPGVYIRDESIGVRIEDMYLVTDDGFERLTAGAPREIEELERR